jgi:16S rRNA (cytidine1402-2'-O)-methyltransferase
MKKEQSGILYICGTPIGNLEDITLRCLNVLKKVDLIAAEDTRHTKILLDHYQIKKPCTSYHKYSKEKKVEYILQLLQEGKDIALLSDAGMPGICDPGYEIISRAIENNITIIPVPGVSALTAALVVSGFAMERFVFEGFIPRKKGEKERFFLNLKDEERTIIFYEAPHRIKDTLNMLKETMGDRRIVVARELTKRFEEIIRGRLSSVADSLNNREIKGEITLVLEGNRASEKEFIFCIQDSGRMDELEKEIQNYVNQGYYNKDIVSLITEEYDISKKWVYEKVLELRKRRKDIE